MTLKRTAMRRSTKNAATVPTDVRWAVYSRDNWQCQRCGRVVEGIAFGLQHRKPRGAGGRKGAAAVESYSMANLVLLCGVPGLALTCNHEVEIAERSQAYDDGWLVREHEDPAAVPCLTYRGWEQPGDRWETA